jgi:hypothetical protein
MIEYTLEDSVGLCGSPLSVSPNAITLNGNTLDHRGLSRDTMPNVAFMSLTAQAHKKWRRRKETEEKKKSLKKLKKKITFFFLHPRQPEVRYSFLFQPWEEEERREGECLVLDCKGYCDVITVGVCTYVRTYVGVQKHDVRVLRMVDGSRWPPVAVEMGYRPLLPSRPRDSHQVAASPKGLAHRLAWPRASAQTLSTGAAPHLTPSQA